MMSYNETAYGLFWDDILPPKSFLFFRLKTLKVISTGKVLTSIFRSNFDFFVIITHYAAL